jgi:hypothetical protein
MIAYSVVTVWPPVDKITYLVAGLSAVQLLCDVFSFLDSITRIWTAHWRMLEQEKTKLIFLVVSFVLAVCWLVFRFQFTFLDKRQKDWAVLIATNVVFLKVLLVFKATINELPKHKLFNGNMQAWFTALVQSTVGISIQLSTWVSIFLATNTLNFKWWIISFFGFIFNIASTICVLIAIRRKTRLLAISSSFIFYVVLATSIFKFVVFIVADANQAAYVRDVAALEMFSQIIQSLLPIGWMLTGWNIE